MNKIQESLFCWKILWKSVKENM